MAFSQENDERRLRFFNTCANFIVAHSPSVTLRQLDVLLAKLDAACGRPSSEGALVETDTQLYQANLQKVEVIANRNFTNEVRQQTASFSAFRSYIPLPLI